MQSKIESLVEKALPFSLKEKETLPHLQTSFSQELEKLLGTEFADWALTLPKEIFQQIEALHQPSILNNKNENNHWQYELNMVRAVCELRREILLFFNVPESGPEYTQFMQELLFMIIISDIGKAGPEKYSEKKPSAVAARIYNNVILENKHGEKIKEVGIKELFSKSSEQFYGSTVITQRVRQIIYQISGSKKKSFREFAAAITNSQKSNTTLISEMSEQLQEILEGGKVRSLPIELALIVARKIAITELIESEQNGQKLGIRKKRKQITQIRKTFSLTDAEKQFLDSHGFATDTRPIGDFYSQSHIQFGKQFLFSLNLTGRLRNRALLGLKHHFVQGVLPDSRENNALFIRRSKTDPNILRDLKIVAFLEMLDKVEASVHRPPYGNPFTGENPEKFMQAIKQNLKTNYTKNHEYLASVYEEVFTAMQNMGIFQFVRALK